MCEEEEVGEMENRNGNGSRIKCLGNLINCWKEEERIENLQGVIDYIFISTVILYTQSARKGAKHQRGLEDINSNHNPNKMYFRDYIFVF